MGTIVQHLFPRQLASQKPREVKGPADDHRRQVKQQYCCEQDMETTEPGHHL